MPKSRSFRFVVPGSPAEVKTRLSARTRLRPLPHQTSVLGSGDLGGRVTRKGFTVSNDDRAVLRRLVAVATGTFVDRGDGTTLVEGVIGMQTWVTWSLRLGALAVPVFALFALFQVFFTGAGLSFLALFAVGMAGMLALAVASTGWQVTNVEGGIDALHARLESALGATHAATETQPEVQRTAPRARAVER